MCGTVEDMDVIWQLVLKDIEAASNGNDAARTYAQAIGIHPEEYLGALKNSWPEVNGPSGPQQYQNTMALKFMPEMDKVAECRLAATDYIMQYH